MAALSKEGLEINFWIGGERELASALEKLKAASVPGAKTQREEINGQKEM